MKGLFRLVVVAMSVALSGTVAAQEPGSGERLFFEPRFEDPALKEIEKRNDDRKATATAETAAIRKTQQEAAARKKEGKQVLRAALPESELPGAPESFSPAFHFEPQAQYLTGTCWAFAATSLMESEIFRLTGKKIKMSEMHTVYYEYVEKARRFVRERGDSVFAEGSQHRALTRIWGMYGAVPLEAYKGVEEADGRHDHSQMSAELSSFLKFVKNENRWDEEWVLAVVRSILDRYLGAPPVKFKWEGKSYTPLDFMRSVCKVKPDDYVEFMSTMTAPFFETAEFEVPDNWWHDDSYNNVPLDLFYATLDGAVKAGYTVAIGGDVSEPGKAPRQDIAFVPASDIPEPYINQEAREFRIENGTTGDDHGIHLLGRQEKGDRTWFLIKDSGRSARYGRFEGYYFFRDDFIRLKMLTFMVHKDAVADALKQMKPKTPQK